MGTEYPKVKVAAVQAAPVLLDREASIDKACSLIREAGRSGARVIGFPEGFVPGHPIWYHFHPATAASSRRLATELFKNSVEIRSPATDKLCAAARDAGAYVVMGMCERRPGTLGTLYNSQLFISPDGEILGKHQKLVPTTAERLVHAPGAGDTLRVFDTKFGGLSGLICGENSNPLAIFALIADNAAIHVASWPNAPSKLALPRSDRAEMTGRSFAFMSKAFVINACGALTPEIIDVVAYTDEDREHLQNRALSGGSSIIAPDSKVIAGPLQSEEGILYADADLEQCVSEKVVHDFAGHYNRADVFRLELNEAVPAMFRRVGQVPAAASDRSLDLERADERPASPPPPSSVMAGLLAPNGSSTEQTRDEIRTALD